MFSFQRHSRNLLLSLGKDEFDNRGVASLLNPFHLYLCFFFVENATETDRKSFLEELNVMKGLPPHNNVITLLGCVTKSGNICSE